MPPFVRPVIARCSRRRRFQRKQSSRNLKHDISRTCDRDVSLVCFWSPRNNCNGRNVTYGVEEVSQLTVLWQQLTTRSSTKYIKILDGEKLVVDSSTHDFDIVNVFKGKSVQGSKDDVIIAKGTAPCYPRYNPSLIRTEKRVVLCFKGNRLE